MNFSSSLRERVVAEALRSQTQGEIAEQFGVGRSTVQNWLRQSRKNGSKMDSKTKKPQSWSRDSALKHCWKPISFLKRRWGNGAANMVFTRTIWCSGGKS